MHHKSVKHSQQCLLPAGPAHPLFDNRATDEVASPEERSDEGSLLSFVTPFGSYPCALFHFAYNLFCTPNSFPSIVCALFRKTRGVGINSSQSGTLAPSSTNHESQVTDNSFRGRFLQTGSLPVPLSPCSHKVG